ncbi:MAG: sulfurtransferase [Deltaproteobacteria bacterium]|nr:sulfurtransferase [Deltaproteobacteria bacterium]
MLRIEKLIAVAALAAMITGCGKNEAAPAPAAEAPKAEAPAAEVPAAAKAEAKAEVKAEAKDDEGGDTSALPTGTPPPVSDFVIAAKDALALHGKENVVFVYAGSKAAYDKGHIPGSVNAFAHDMQYLDDVQKCEGLPMCPENAAKFIGGLGIGNDTQVIAYEDGKGVNESGVWFFLTLYGHKNVKMMEGGTVGWEAAGGKLDTAEVTPKAATFAPAVNKDMVATRAEVEVATKGGGALLLDARHTLPEYTGTDLKDGMKNATEHVTVKRGGHIPGAVFSPWTKYAGNKGGGAEGEMFRPTDKLRKQLSKLGKKGYAPDKTMVTYCHVGLGRSTFQYLGLRLAGHDKAKVYVGSWSEWGNSDLPVETE